MPKIRGQVYIIAFGLGVLLALVFELFILFTVYFIKEGSKVLEQDWLLSFYINFIQEIDVLILSLFAAVLLGIYFSREMILRKRIESVNLENEGLIEANQIKTEFVAFVTHQLRTPLSALRLSLMMSLAGDFGELNEEYRSIAEKNLKEVGSLLSLVDNLLDVSKIEIRQMKLKKTAFFLKVFFDLIDDFIKQYILLAKEKEIVLEYRPDQKNVAGYLRIDWDKVKQILEALLDNSLKYTPTDGRIVLATKLGKGLIMVSVSDNGIGIPVSEQKDVFDKFFRASNAKKHISRGTGLGLYLVKSFVEGHGGKIWFKSKENEGVTFYFTLPIKTEFEDFLEGV